MNLNSEFLADFFKAPILYKKLLESRDFVKQISEIKLTKKVYNQELIKNVEKII